MGCCVTLVSSVTGLLSQKFSVHGFVVWHTYNDQVVRLSYSCLMRLLGAPFACVSGVPVLLQYDNLTPVQAGICWLCCMFHHTLEAITQQHSLAANGNFSFTPGVQRLSVPSFPECIAGQHGCRSHLAQASMAQAGATAASKLGQVIAGVPLYTWLFCGMIVMSRVAFWVYDMVDAQIFQTVQISLLSL